MLSFGEVNPDVMCASTTFLIARVYTATSTSAGAAEIIIPIFIYDDTGFGYTRGSNRPIPHVATTTGVEVDAGVCVLV